MVVPVLSPCPRPGALPPKDPPAADSIQLERNTACGGVNLGLIVIPDDGTVASVNTTHDVIRTRPGWTPVPGHRAWAGTFLGETRGGGRSAAHCLLRWDPEYPADSIECGWWMRIPGQLPPELSFAETEQCALIDGTEGDRGVVPEPPVEETASDDGPVGGLSTHRGGSDRASCTIPPAMAPGGRLTVGRWPDTPSTRCQPERLDRARFAATPAPGTPTAPGSDSRERDVPAARGAGS